ncbi:MAG: 50S ribosomal protein L11 [Erysipelothrix sp.]|nr:50S ribosomal protein L11 [Erysipelothrix sp.]
MSKRVVKVVKLQFPAGGARPGPALAGVGVNMPQFCSAFNDATRERVGDVVPVVITAFEDKSFTFELKTSPASVLLKKYAGVKSGSDKAHITKVGKITVDQLREIATYKLPDLNANDVEGAMKIIAGTAKNMGIIIEGFGE